MQALARDGVFQFEGFRFDLQSRVLFRRDEAGAFVPMAVGSRALDVLDVLLDRAGSLVLRDAFMAAVWPGDGGRGHQSEHANCHTTPGPRRGTDRTELHPDYPRAGLPVRRPGDPGRGEYLGTTDKRPTAATR